MNESLRYLFFTFALLCIAGCSETAEEKAGVSEQQRTRIESAVINRFNAMIKYSEAGELENVLSHFDETGPGSYIDGGTRYRSYQDMVDYYRAIWQIKKQDYGIPDTRVYVLSPNFVLVTSSSVITTTTRAGIVFQPRAWSVTTLWMLKDGEWKIHSFQQFLPEGVPVEEKEKAA